jgi:hypothetical protein
MRTLEGIGRHQMTVQSPTVVKALVVVRSASRAALQTGGRLSGEKPQSESSIPRIYRDDFRGLTEGETGRPRSPVGQGRYDRLGAGSRTWSFR